MPFTREFREVSVSLLMVCVEDRLSKLALDAADRYWSITEHSFHSYVSHARRPHLSDHLKSSDGFIVMINFDRDPLEAANSASYLLDVFGRRTVVVAMAKEMTPQLILTAMRAGCTEFLEETADDDDLSGFFERVEQQLARRATISTTSGSIFSFLGAKGGVGTTTLAVHLAVFLVEEYDKKVLLIDNQAQFGHVCIYLGLDGSNVHFQEVVSNVNRLDSELLRGFVAKHPSGLDVLSSPDVGQTARLMDAGDVASTLEFLRSEYDFVLVDCAGRLDEVSRAVLAASAHVYVVATPEISALRDLSRYVDDLRLRDDNTKVKAVINRYSSQFAVSLAEIEEAIRMPVAHSVPNSYIELVRSANLGVPLGAKLQNGFTKELMNWALALVGTSASVQAQNKKVNIVSRCFQFVKDVLLRRPAAERLMRAR